MHKGKSIGQWERFDLKGNLKAVDSGVDPNYLNNPTEEDSLIDRYDNTEEKT